MARPTFAHDRVQILASYTLNTGRESGYHLAPWPVSDASDDDV
jgi:hypothetical protein